MSSIFETFKKPTKENTLLFGSILPSLSFVEYRTYKIKGAEVYWLNEDYCNENKINITTAQQEILDNFAYVSDNFTLSSEIDINDSKVFLADRYGSPGEVCNGGSARCGINGNFQVKGNGTNPLVAINVDEGHSTGKLPLAEAVSEAIWSEICHRELPYGALRIIAIIKTPQTITIANTFGETVEQPCALMVREVASRPAHYEPALNFWPRQEFAYLRNANHMISSQAVSKLEQQSSIQFGTELPLYESTKQFVTRFAKQVAASRVKGMPHGSLTSSNIALDGRFLDLGTISAVGDFSNVILTAGLGATWDDHESIVIWLNNYFYYLNKNSDYGLTKSERSSLIQIFLTTLENSENIYTAQQCGIDPSNPQLSNIGQKLKYDLRKDKEKVSRLVDFEEDKFNAEVEKALDAIGYQDSTPDFKYRKQKFSRFTIFSDKRLQGLCGSKGDIQTLINEYIHHNE
ncbi:protein adenylyltransferase SelO family protein [Vibrio cionasavignyae]|uniref:protein adenylyltransferase SelO family protein n=1 Tax=Vibrio cionasavignyae TaxID=2910252 RepID=UPI003D0E7774